MGHTDNAALKAALDCLAVFASVGADRFEVTLLTQEGKRADYRSGMSHSQLRHALRYQLPEAERHQYSVVIRPRSPRVTFLQLDDLDDIALNVVRPVALLTLKTSPTPKGNQAWLALEEPPDPDFGRRVRKAAPGEAGADRRASGATRIPGSTNFKDKYAPDFPRVAMTYSSPGRITTREELQARGLVAPPEVFEAPARASAPRRRPGFTYPSYAVSLASARTKADGSGPDRSDADWKFCMNCFDPEWSREPPTVEEVAAHLLEVSPKAQEEAAGGNPGYAHVTAQRAWEAVQRRPRALGR